jgi:beta-glucosidase
MDVPNAPLFGFGAGLSYGRFLYSDLELSATTLKENGTLTVSMLVRNDGRHAAEETIFLFIHDKVASVTRPLLELKGFEKIALQPGTEGTISFSLPGAAFRFPGPGMKPVFEPGEVEILAGPAADRARLVSASLLLQA